MSIDLIKVGDLLHYCPVDLKQSYHDIGIIYNITEVGYEVFWSRSQDSDTYTKKTLERRLAQKILGKNIMCLIKQNGTKETSL